MQNKRLGINNEDVTIENESLSPSQKGSSNQTAVDKMVANLRATANESCKTQAVLVRPHKGETKEHFKERLSKALKISSP